MGSQVSDLDTLPDDPLNSPSCTMGGKHAGGGSVILWAVFCWEALGPALHVDVRLTPPTNFNTVAEEVHPFLERYSVMSWPHSAG